LPPESFTFLPHAFFKALLFLGSGSVIHAMSGEQDMRNMGDLHKRIPITHWTMFIATFAIAGIPPYRRIFLRRRNSVAACPLKEGPYRLLWLIGFITALMDGRSTCSGSCFSHSTAGPRMSHEVEHHIHESPKSMTVPLIILAPARFGRRLAWMAPQPRRVRSFCEFLEPVFARRQRFSKQKGRALNSLPVKKKKNHTSPIEYGLNVSFQWGAAVIGWGHGLARVPQADKGTSNPIAAKAPALYDVLYNKYYVDEGYDYAFTAAESRRYSPGRDGRGRSSVLV